MTDDSTCQPDLFSYTELNDPANTATSPLATETALAISYNGISHAVMMVSPENLDDFVRGFTLSNGIVTSLAEIHDLELAGWEDNWRAEVSLSNRALWALKQNRRQLAGVSGCGICGVEALEQALPELAALVPEPVPEAAVFHGIRDRISAFQQHASTSGAMHAALYADGGGTIRLCREDIGRHNALDKLIGGLMQTDYDLKNGMVVMTSRCSVELVIKAVRAGVATLASLAAPSGATVRLARRYRLNLVHIPHYSSPRLYSPAPFPFPP